MNKKTNLKMPFQKLLVIQKTAFLVLFAIFSMACITGKKTGLKLKTATASTEIEDTTAIKIDKLINSYAGVGQSFSGTVLLAKNGTIIYHKSFGMANRELNIPYSNATKNNIASIGKVFTASVIMKLVQDNKIKLSDTLGYYLPDAPDWLKHKVTIQHLLTHTSGIFNYYLDSLYEKHMQDYSSINQIKPFIFNHPLNFEPGAHYEYSNSNFVILSMIIEKVTKKEYFSYLKKNLFDVAGMRNTKPFNPKIRLQDKAQGYTLTQNGTFVALSAQEPPAFGDGGIYTTAEDLFRFDQFLYTDSLLNTINKNKMWQAYSDSGRYGYGWQINIKGEGYCVGHSGAVPGFRNMYLRFPNEKNTLIILANSEVPRSLVADLRNILYGKEPVSAPKMPLTRFLFKKINESGIDFVVTHIDSIVTTNGYSLDRPDYLNDLGYELVNQKMNKEALSVFKLNVLKFDKDANTHDSLGEMYLMLGNKTLALKYYQSALALNPNYENAANAKKIIERLSQ